jgi:hypothetical protein
MRRLLLAPLGCLLLLGAGCDRPAPPPRTSPPATSHESSRPAERPDRAGTHKAELSFDTPHDEKFAKFVAATAGNMVRKVAVGIERKGVMRVQLGESAAPEDTLPLTKSLLAGARKDFPGKPITVSVYDPAGEPILKAHYQSDTGVRYEVARSDHAADTNRPRPDGPADAGGGTAGVSQSGTTEKDRRFAEWATEKGQRYLRYVQADLEQRGRLWFGVTREVAPADVSDLAKALLQGARTEFPGRELTATVFDPDGERIGKASLDRSGTVHWSR